MPLFAIVENEDGLTVAEMAPGATPEETATRHGGMLIDAGPFHSFDEAYDAAVAIQLDEDDD
jgi:hypothetical protein